MPMELPSLAASASAGVAVPLQLTMKQTSANLLPRAFKATKKMIKIKTKMT